MSTLPLRLSRWGKSSYETQESIDNEKRQLQEIIEVVEDNSNAEIIVVHSKLQVDEHVILQCPNLQYVITTTSGYDHLNIKALHNRGIQAIRMPLLRRDAVVETTLGLILQGSRRLLVLRDASIHKGWVRHLCIRQVLGSRPGSDLFRACWVSSPKKKECSFVPRGAHLIHSSAFTPVGAHVTCFATTSS